MRVCCFSFVCGVWMLVLSMNSVFGDRFSMCVRGMRLSELCSLFGEGLFLFEVILKMRFCCVGFGVEAFL